MAGTECSQKFFDFCERCSRPREWRLCRHSQMQYNQEVVLHFSIWSRKGYQGLMEAVSVKQTDVFEAAEYFARVEGILPAPENSHAIRVAIDEALKCKETGEEKTIVFGLTGTGYFDMVAYEKFHDGEMSDYIPTDEELENYRVKLPKID